MKYYVVSRYYNSGKVDAKLLPESKVSGEPWNKTTSSYDQYIDTFESRSTAEKFIKDTMNA